MFIKRIFLCQAEKSNLLFFTIIIFLLSFPKIEPTYSGGLDPSLPFALNYFFLHGIHFGKDVIFTYGPLSFLHMPLPMGNNLIWSIGFISIVYLTFIYTALFLGYLINKKKWLLHIGVVFLLCQMIGIDDLLIGTTAISLLLHYETTNRKWLFIALLGSMFGLYIKSSFGVVCLLLIFSYLLIHYFLFRNFKKTLIISAGIIVLYFLFWFLIYLDFQGCLKFLWATFQLAKDNSDAVAVYPENNWWLLGTALTTFALIPVVARDRKIYILFFLFLLSTFASWKHSYSREEEVHLTVFYHFLILFFSVFIIFINRTKPLHIVLITVSLIALYRNMILTGYYHRDDRIQIINGLNNFCEVFFDYNNLVGKSITVSRENILSKKLPKEVLNKIGNESVDVYPWDFSYIAANHLNWKPRPVIQSYAAYTEWLDNQDAMYFLSDKSAKYIIWELINDRGQKGFYSIDNRYLLNDEPCAIVEFFRHYTPIYKNEDIILFQKTERENFSPPRIIKSDTVAWNQWIRVPPFSKGITRVKVKFRMNILGALKTFIYKGEAFRIDCQRTDSTVVHYRIIQDNAEDGIWINPLFEDVRTDTVRLSKVNEIKFTCSNENLMKENIFIEWEAIELRKERISVLDSIHSITYNDIFRYLDK